MAISSFMAKPSSSTDALFRDWGSKLSAAIQAVGLVKTGDTGQINWSTVTVGTGIRGYEIFRFNDSLQATTPVFIKIEYGHPTSTTSYVLFRTTVGKGTDGAGNITGVLHTALANANGSQDSTNDFVSYVSSGDGSMLNISLFPTWNATYSPMLKFSLERSRDAGGNPTTTGTFCYRFATGFVPADGNRSEASDYSTGQTNIIKRCAINTGYEISQTTTLNNGSSTMLFNAEVVNPARQKWKPRSILAYANADAGTLQTINVGGVNYLTLGVSGGSYSDVGKQQYCCLAMAYY